MKFVKLAFVLLLTIALLCAYFYWPIKVNSRYDKKPIAIFPIKSNGQTTIRQLFDFTIDTGTGYSTINMVTIDSIKATGSEIKRSLSPLFTYDVHNHIGIQWWRNWFAMPVPQYEQKGNSITHIISKKAPYNYLENVCFYVNEGGYNVIGMNILQQFVVEYKPKERAIYLWDEVPEGYEQLTEMKRFNNDIADISGKRYYIDVSIHGQDKRFFLDTGFGYQTKIGDKVFAYIPLKCPSSDTTQIQNLFRVEEIEIEGFRSVRKKKFYVENKATVSVGDYKRNGLFIVYGDLRTPYTLNPFVFFKEDVVLDFKKEKIYIKSAHPETN